MSAIATHIPAGVTRHYSSYDEWADYGQKLATSNIKLQWAIGDWINDGEKLYGEKYTQALESFDLRVQTLMNYAYVARAIPTDRRRPALPHSTHADVASLPPATQDECLNVAQERSMDRETFREFVNEVKVQLHPDKVLPPAGCRKSVWLDPEAKHALQELTKRRNESDEEVINQVLKDAYQWGEGK